MFGAEEEYGEDALMSKLEGIQGVIEQVNKQFRNPVRSYIVACFWTYNSSLNFLKFKMHKGTFLFH